MRYPAQFLALMAATALVVPALQLPGVAAAPKAAAPVSLAQVSPADRMAQGNALFDESLQRLQESDYQGAWDLLQQALAIYQAPEVQEVFPQESQLKAAWALTFLGGISRRFGQYPEALEYYQGALEILQDPDMRSALPEVSRRGEGVILNNVGLVYDNLGRYEEALSYYRDALDIRREINHRHGEGITLNNIGLVYDNLGQYELALSYLQDALSIRREVDDRSGEGVTLNNIGLVAYKLGQYDKAMDYLQDALIIRREIGDRSGEGTTLNNIGGVYDALSQYEQALSYYQDALVILQEIGDRNGEGATRHNIGAVYRALGQYEEALRYYQDALAIRQEIGARSGEGSTLNSIGLAYSDLGQYEQALSYLQDALAIRREIGDRSGEGGSLNNIAEIYRNLEQYEQALIYFQDALVILQEIGNRSGEGTTLNNIGAVYNNLGQYEEALSYYQDALAIRQAIGDRSGRAGTLNNIGYTFDALDTPELAIIFLKQSVNQYEEIRGDIQGLATADQQAFTDSIAGSYRKLADLLLAQDRVLEAQRVLDLLKVQELDEYLDNVRATAQTASGVVYLRPEQAILDRYRDLQASAIALGQELAALNAKKTAGQITAPEEQRRLQLEALRGELAAQFNGFIDDPDVVALLDQLDRQVLRQTVDLEELAALRNNLADLNAVLFYPLILEDRIELVITTAATEPLRRTVEGVGREQLNAAITEFRQALQNPAADAESPAQQLYRWLVEPLEADLAAAGVDTIIYAPDGALRYIPLAALHDGQGWLTQRFRVNNITARSLQELTAEPTLEPRVLAGAFADDATLHSVGGFDFYGLPFAGKEVELLSSTLPATTALVDERFGLQQVLPEIGRFNILHFATHAAFLPGDPAESFILFGNGDAPTLKDIETWPLADVDLVVLSACETGLGGFDNNGEQILGLGYQFQKRGAKAVIASLWLVNDNSTQVLMNGFYSALQQGMPKSEALRQAQIALITDDYTAVGGNRGVQVVSADTGEPLTGDDLSHPFYWAPFILIGNGL